MRVARFLYIFLIIRSCGCQIATEPDNRFCQVCDGSSGYSGSTISVHGGVNKINCSLRCRALPECQLASYSEATRTCTLMTNVTQICSETTTDIQLMDENDIDPIIPTTVATTTEISINDTASTESATSDIAGMTSIDTSSTATTRITSSTSSTTQTPFLISGHPWITALTYNSSQNGSQLAEMSNLISYGLDGSDITLLVTTADLQMSMPVDRLKVSWYPYDACVDNLAFFVHFSYQPRKSVNSLCTSSQDLVEVTWPASGSTITVDNLPYESVSFFTRDYSGKYTFDLGFIGDMEFVRDILRGGKDIRFKVNNYVEMYSADILYFSNHTNAVYAVVRRHAEANITDRTLDFAQILHTIDTSECPVETLRIDEAGTIKTSTRNAADDNSQIFLQGDWTKVFEITDKGDVTYGAYIDLQNALRQGHRIKIMVNNEFIAVPDFIIEVEQDTRILVVIVDEFLQSNGSFTTHDINKVWREYDTYGSEKKCILSMSDEPQSETLTNVKVTWFIDSDPWSTYYVNSDSSNDISSLKRAIEFGSRVRLMYHQSSNPSLMRIFIDVPFSAVSGSYVGAKSPTLLDYNFSPGAPMCDSDTKYLHFEFFTNGNAIKYVRTLGSAGTDSASTLVNYYDVSWFTDQVV